MKNAIRALNRLSRFFTRRERRCQQFSCTYSRDVLPYLEQRALILASLLARGASEACLAHRSGMDAAEIVTRQFKIPSSAIVTFGGSSSQQSENSRACARAN